MEELSMPSAIQYLTRLEALKHQPSTNAAVHFIEIQKVCYNQRKRGNNVLQSGVPENFFLIISIY